MKKTTLFAVLIAIIPVCKGQSLFGVFAGPQVSTSKYTINSLKQPTQHKQGFQGGFGWKIPFEAPLFFTPAAFYSLKGYKVKFNSYTFPPDTLATDNNTTIHTLELAFLLQLDIGNKPGHFFIKAGPSLDFQLLGKEKFNVKPGGYISRDMPFSFIAYGHYSANLLFQLGFETKGGFIIYGHYTHGLASINNADGGPEIRHRVFGISIGQYFINKNKKIVLDTRNKE